MKKVAIMCSAVVMIVAFMGAAFAGGMQSKDMKASTSDLIQNNYSVGIGYDYNQQKLEPKSTGWGNGEVKQNLIYIKGIYTIDDNSEIYLKIGGADLEIKDGWSDSDFKDGYGFLGVLGIKKTFYQQDDIGIGFFIDGTMYPDYKETKSISGTDITAKYEDIWDITLGIGIETKIDAATVYGGPLFYITNAKASVGAGATYLGQSFTVESTSDYESKGNVGAYVGLDIPLDNGFKINIEIKYKDLVGCSISAVKKL